MKILLKGSNIRGAIYNTIQYLFHTNSYREPQKCDTEANNIKNNSENIKTKYNRSDI